MDTEVPIRHTHFDSSAAGGQVFQNLIPVRANTGIGKQVRRQFQMRGVVFYLLANIAPHNRIASFTNNVFNDLEQEGHFVLKWFTSIEKIKDIKWYFTTRDMFSIKTLNRFYVKP
jgi:hypothetical protein